MKRINNNIKFFISAILFVAVVAACSSSNDSVEAPNISKITTIKDVTTALTEANMGDWIAIGGVNLTSIDSVMFNDISVYPKDFYAEDSALYVQVPVKLPTKVDNKVTLKSKGGDVSYTLKVNIPNLQLTSMFNEYTQPGDTIKIYGKFLSLYEVSSENTVIRFGDKESPVIKATDTYLTTKVPADAGKNVQVSAHNSKYNVDAVCAGRYRDNKWMIVDFDNNGTDGTFVVQDQHNKKQVPFPTSGNYLRFYATPATYPDGLGWLYITSNDYTYTKDMMMHPENYVLKFELNMGLPIKTTQLFIYYYWNHSPKAMGGETFTVQNYGIWQTVTIPLSEIMDATDGSSTDFSMNIRIENSNAPIDETIDMSFDNFRICEK